MSNNIILNYVKELRGQTLVHDKYNLTLCQSHLLIDTEICVIK